MFVFVFALQVSAATLTKANRLHFPDCIGISNGIKIKIENEIAIAIEMEIEKGNRVVDFRRQGRICYFFKCVLCCKNVRSNWCLKRCKQIYICKLFLTKNNKKKYIDTHLYNKNQAIYTRVVNINTVI